LLLISALPLALFVAPSVVHGQRIVYRDCYDRYNSYGVRYYGCSYDPDIAARAREAAARAREASARARTEAREAANWARSYARSYSYDTRAWERNLERARLRAIDTRIRNEQRAAELRERSRERAAESRERARERAAELRERSRERAAEARERALRNRYYHRW
jgi:hypothetical protein